MRILTVITGLLFISCGGFLIAKEGITFISVAFVVGVLFIVAGIVEVLSHSAYRGDGEDRTWVLIDGLTTFALGSLIILDKISADIVVPQVLGLWVLIAGIRNFVRAGEHLDVRNSFFYDHLIVGILNLLVGFYVFFDADIFHLTTITLIGLCIVVQGINLCNVGLTIRILKPDIIKTKEEMLSDAAKKARDAQLAAREALEAAKAAQTEFREVALTPAEVIDKTLAPKPAENVEDALKGLSEKM